MNVVVIVVAIHADLYIQINYVDTRIHTHDATKFLKRMACIRVQ